MDLLAIIAFAPTALILLAGALMHIADRGYGFDLRRNATRVSGGRRIDDPRLRLASR